MEKAIFNMFYRIMPCVCLYRTYHLAFRETAFLILGVFVDIIIITWLYTLIASLQYLILIRAWFPWIVLYFDLLSDKLVYNDCVCPTGFLRVVRKRRMKRIRIVKNKFSTNQLRLVRAPREGHTKVHNHYRSIDSLAICWSKLFLFKRIRSQ